MISKAKHWTEKATIACVEEGKNLSEDSGSSDFLHQWFPNASP